jgi:flagellar biosynthetic protein FliP
MKRCGVAAFVLLVLLASSSSAYAAPEQLNVNIDGIGGISAPLQLVVVLTLLSFVPAALVIMTCFTRIVIVFHFLRQALGTQEMPSNQILIGLTLFLTMFIMAPVAEQETA